MRRLLVRVGLAVAAGAVLVLGPSAALAQAPAAPTNPHHTGSMCAGMSEY